MQNSAVYADVNGASVSTVSGSILSLTISTVENTSGTNPELASMVSLTVAQNQEVKLSGAKMALTATASVTNGGDLSIEGGESAKLTLNIAPSENDRDVRVLVKDNNGSNPGYYTVHVPAGPNTIDVKSGRFIKGQPYLVTITDTDQYSPNNDNSLTVNVAANGDSTIPSEKNEINSISALDGSGAKFTFFGNAVSTWDGSSAAFTVSPGTFTFVPGDIPSLPASITYTIDNDVITFHVTGAVEKQEIHIAKTTNAENTCTFERTLVIEKQTSGTKDYVVSAKLDSSYYYVSTEIDAKAQADRDDITASDITAKAVTNNGTLTVASVSQGASASKLVLDVNRNPAENRSIQVTVGDETDPRTLFIRKDASTADLFLNNTKVGTQYSDVTIYDSYTFTTDEAASSTMTLSGFATTGERDSLTITVKKGFELVGTWENPVVNDDGIVVLNGEFAPEELYTVSVTETRNLTLANNPDEVTTKSLATLTATDTVTNTDKINVTDAVFTAAAVENSGTITITNSQFTVGGLVTNYITSGDPATTIYGTITLDAKSSLLTAQNILNDASGAVTINADDFSGMRKVIDLNEGEADSKITVVRTDSGSAYRYYKTDTFDYWVADAPQTTLFVNGDWAGHGYGFGDTVETGKYYGYNAFDNIVEALTVARGLSTGAEIKLDPNNPGSVSGQDMLFYDGSAFAGNTSITATEPTTVTIGFKGTNVNSGDNGLMLTPAAGGNFTIGSGVTLQTEFTADTGTRVEDTGSVYLNYNGTTGTVTVAGNINASGDIKVYGASTITGNLTAGTNGNEKYLLVLRAGKANEGEPPTANKAVTISRTVADDENPQVSAGWFLFASGDVVTTNSNISVTGFRYTNTLDNPAAASKTYLADKEFADGKAVLTSTDTKWNVGFVEAGHVDIQKNAEFNFSGGAFNVSGTAGLGTNEAVELGDKITLNLTNNAAFNVANGKINNAGTINVTNATVSAASLDNTKNNSDPDDDGTFTVAGTSELHINELNGTITLADGGSTTPTTLKDTEIHGKTGTGGKLAAQGNLTFVAAESNNLLTSIELDASGHTVTVGSGTLTVGGTSKLTIGTLSGTIKLLDGATLTTSSITGGIITASGAVTVNNSIISSNTFTATAGGATFSGSNTLNGVTLTATGKTVENTGMLVMDLSSQITAASIDNGSSGTITIDPTGFDSADGMKKVISLTTDDSGALANSVNFTVDGYFLAYRKTSNNGCEYWVTDVDNSSVYVDSSWNTDDYGAAVSGETKKYSGYNAFSTIEASASADTSEIVIKDGTYGGTESNPTAPVSFEGISSIVQNGEFNHSLSGGCQLVNPDEPLTGGFTMSVENGTFRKMVNAGDYVLSGCAIRGKENDRSELVLTVNGGTFKNYLVGGMAYVSTETSGLAKLIGDINLTINGGTFERYIYGGSMAKTKQVSALTEIRGNIAIQVNADEANISMKQLICGSYNLGKVFGDITLTLSGSGSKLHFVDGGEIWGGNGAEYHDANGTLVTNMEGWVVHSRSNTPPDSVTTRTLSFTGFSGTLDCPKIRAFSDIEFIGNTNVILSENTVDLSKVEFWKIEYNTDAAANSSLKGDFANNFTGDTLTLDMTALTGDLAENWSWTILENSREGAFAGFGEEGLTVNLVNGDSSTLLSWDSTNKRYYANGCGYYLKLDNMDSPTKMMLTLA